MTYPGDIVEARPNCAGACDFGPFSATVDGLIYQAKFCSDYSNYTFNASGLDMAVSNLFICPRYIMFKFTQCFVSCLVLLPS